MQNSDVSSDELFYRGHEPVTPRIGSRRLFFRLVFSSKGRKLLLVILFVLALLWQPPSISHWIGVQRDQFLHFAGFGAVGIVLWSASVLLMLYISIGRTLRLWRVWLSTAFLVASSFAILGLVDSVRLLTPGNSLGGLWGSAMSGSSLAIGVVWILLLVFLSALILVPRMTINISFITARFLCVKLRSRVMRLVGILSRVAFIAVRAVTSYMIAMARRLVRMVLNLILGHKFDPQPEESVPADTGVHMAMSKNVPEVSMAVKRTPDKVEKAANAVNTDSNPLQLSLPWFLPTTELLDKPQKSKGPGPDLLGMSRLITQTLRHHGVEVDVAHVKPGPRVILFGLSPGWNRRYKADRKKIHTEGTDIQSSDKVPSNQDIELSRVRVDSILAREKDLALALAASSLRIEAPVPGQSVVGVEVPNPHSTLVTLRSVVDSDSFRNAADKGGLAIGLGQDTGGEPVAIDLREMPHLLISGATGSGKSVCINAVICSLLLSRSPDQLRLLLIDPKRVELTPFNGIPHLLAPVVVDTELVVKALRALLDEMFNRYRIFEKAGVRNIKSYREQVHDQEPMPYIILIIDELADLMMAASYDVEQTLVRLGQLARATGIHLIEATQRPSVDVVTGLMKANVPARVGFAVASQVDSRTILDCVGAEKLLGKGDMLFLAPDAIRPRRIQGAFVSDREVERIVTFWKNYRGPRIATLPLAENLAKLTLEPESSKEDELLDQARELALRHSHLSTSLLQRRLRIGYPRAARIVDLLEDEGTVGPGEPGKSRSVIGSREGIEHDF